MTASAHLSGLNDNGIEGTMTNMINQARRKFVKWLGVGAMAVPAATLAPAVVANHASAGVADHVAASKTGGMTQAEYLALDMERGRNPPPGMLRPAASDRRHFQETCREDVRAAASAMRDRIKDLGFGAPYSDDSTAWTDLADVALRAALKAGLRF
jgi:hypothetical protein